MGSIAAHATVTLGWSAGAFLLAFSAVRLVEWLMPERQEIPREDDERHG